MDGRRSRAYAGGMLSVMTLNLGFDGDKHGPWSARRRLVAAAVRARRPDVLALQAVKKDPSTGLDQAAELGDLLPEYGHVLFQSLPNGGPALEGSAFLSRLPLRDGGALRLSKRPGTEDRFSRLLLYACVDTRVGPVRLFNAHFSWVPEQAEDNLREALGAIRLEGRQGVLLGDFNLGPASPLLEPLRRLGWKDAWEQLRPGEAGETFEAPAPSARIDYVWAAPSLARRLSHVDRVAGESPDGRARLSDHLGLVVSLVG